MNPVKKHNDMNASQRAASLKYKNSVEVQSFVDLIHTSPPLDDVPTFEGCSMIVECCCTDNYDSMYDAALDGAVYRLHEENIYSVDQFERLIATFQSTLRCIGSLNATEFLFTLRIEAEGGGWLQNINDLSIDYLSAIISKYQIFQHAFKL